MNDHESDGHNDHNAQKIMMRLSEPGAGIFGGAISTNLGEYISMSTNRINKIRKITISRHIYLPIPQQVTDSITVGYAEDTLNPIQAAW